MKKSNSSIFLFLLIVLFASCQKNESKQKGTLTFSFSSNNLKGEKESSKLDGSEEFPQALVVSIVDNNGNYVKNMFQIPLYNMNGIYISSPISLPEGNYKLIDFIVVNNAGSIIYLTPKEGSPKAYLVNDPLPVGFNVINNQVTKLNVEVLANDGTSPEEYGYTTFSFDIVKVIDIYVDAFIFDENIQNFKLTNASIEIFKNNILVYRSMLGITPNRIQLRKEEGNYNITVKKEGYNIYSSFHTLNELTSFTSSNPLIVILNKLTIDLSNGLVAYYAFSNNANDLSPYNNTGIMNRLVSTFDRNMNPNSAFEFDSLYSYVYAPNHSALNPENAISLFALIKPISFYGSGNNAIIDKAYYFHTYPYYQYHLGMCGDKYKNYPGIFAFDLCINGERYTLHSSSTYIPNKWINVIGTYDGNMMKLYIDGVLEDSLQISGKIVSFGKDLYIGRFNNFNYSTPGTIDEIRIYNRALTQAEINLLAAESKK